MRKWTQDRPSIAPVRVTLNRVVVLGLGLLILGWGALWAGWSLPLLWLWPSPQDFEFDVSGDYLLHRSSAHYVDVAPEGPLAGRPTIPPKVVEICWNERFVLAKQHPLVVARPCSNSRYEVPDPSSTAFWILDTALPRLYGPLTEEEFSIGTLQLGLGRLRLKPVAWYRRESRGSR